MTVRYRATIPRLPISINEDQLANWCARWRITEVALFGSVLRDDFRPTSDVDVLITLSPDVCYGISFVRLFDELQAIIPRRMDLVTRDQMQLGAPTPTSREILATAQVIYHADPA